MKPKKQILKFNKILSYTFVCLIVVPYIFLNLTDWWVIRFIVAPLFLLFISIVALFFTFAPVDYWLSSRNGWKTPKAMGINRAISFVVGFSTIMLLSFTYFKGIARLVMEGGKLEIVTGVIEYVDAQYPSSIIKVNFKIEGRKNEINLCYPKLRICKRFPVGSKAEFYLLPGTDDAMDVKLVSSENTP
jgi:hypothetical protein